MPLQVPALIKHHADLDNFAADAARRDPIGWMTAIHETGHALMALACTIVVRGIELRYSGNNCMGGTCFTDGGDDGSKLYYLAAGLGYEEQLTSRLATRQTRAASAADDLADAARLLGVADPLKDRRFLTMIFHAKADAMKYRDSAIAIALELWNRRGAVVSGDEIEELFSWGCRLP